MKKLLHCLIFGLLLALLTNSSCTEPEPPIPTGNRTFSCRINGKLFLPQGSGGGFSTLPAGDGMRFNEYNNDLSFSASGRNLKKYRVYFGIYKMKIGTFTLTDSDGVFYPAGTGEINHAIVFKNGIKYLSKQGSGTVTFIESSDANRRGTFEFTVYNENNSNDVLRITNGQFDN